METTQNTAWRIKKTEQNNSVSDLWVKTNCSKICVSGVPEEEEGMEIVFEEIMA